MATILGEAIGDNKIRLHPYPLPEAKKETLVKQEHLGALTPARLTQLKVRARLAGFEQVIIRSQNFHARWFIADNSVCYYLSDRHDMPYYTTLAILVDWLRHPIPRDNSPTRRRARLPILSQKERSGMVVCFENVEDDIPW